jgi:hypothetical protein
VAQISARAAADLQDSVPAVKPTRSTALFLIPRGRRKTSSRKG